MIIYYILIYLLDIDCKNHNLLYQEQFYLEPISSNQKWQVLRFVNSVNILYFQMFPIVTTRTSDLGEYRNETSYVLKESNPLRHSLKS